jgi:hypothetical protein
MKKLSFIVEKTDTGFSAYAKDYPIYTVGDNMHELKSNMLDAANTWFDLKGIPAISDSQIDVQLDLPQFFSFYKEINAKAISKRIGMNETLLSQYVNGIKKPSSKQTARILQGIRSLGQELTSLELV